MNCSSAARRAMSLSLPSLLALAVACPFVMAQPKPNRGLEPGQAEAQDRDRPIAPDTKWTQPPVEARGVWIASRDMNGTREPIGQKLDLIKRANLNTALIGTQFRGYVAYPGSAVLPQFPDFKGQDVFGLWVEEAHKRGLRAEAWMEYGFYAYFTPDASKDPSMGPILDNHPDLLSVDPKGTRYIHRDFGDFYSICPSNPKSHQILADLCVEAVTKYPLDGLNLDRIRYAASDYCHCDYCKSAFQRDTGVALVQFPEGSAEAKRWLDWKRDQTAKAVATISKAVRAARPGMPITSYVVGPDEMDDKAQGWDLWAKRGFVDALAVSMYGADIEPAASKALALLGDETGMLICAINAGMKTPIFASNVEVARKHAPTGQFVWHFGDLADDVEALTTGPYQKPAEYPKLTDTPGPAVERFQP